MKKRFFSVVLILCMVDVSSSFACEICGCANGNFQIGLLPNFSKGFFGYRYSASKFNSQVRNEPSEFSHDYYKTMEVWGGYNIKRFQLMAFMPYVFSRKVTDDGTTSTQGAGDFMLLVNYKILSAASLTKDESGSVRNDLYVGGGIKLPTGVNRVDPGNPDFNVGDFSSQAGTGSLDFILNATHNVMWNRSGVVTNAAYRINSANKQGYKFGNRTYANVAYYYSINRSALNIKPSAGLNFQSNTINTFQGAQVADSNGYNLSITAGANFLFKKIGFNVTGFAPVAQNMYDGQTKASSRVLLGITYSF